MRIRKRIDSALNLFKRCNKGYVIFWASIWNFKLWSKYLSQFSNQIVILKP